MVGGAASVVDDGGRNRIALGFVAHERAAVVAAFAPALVVWEREEDGWVGLVLR